ncbi:CocE/NonD family hydrolase [Solicola gregarius]|uniref:CocE/NonD family hydrolase n=1 Tax=Solicola gregarius TaxID=2908642 RepID=A0AA46TLR2_9ACTN|nr:CocE/NonD family hydrolase [Solicola gregarius]UYM07585.1 CocE/NonD family hydrolase [Solicola gregarius]
MNSYGGVLSPGTHRRGATPRPFADVPADARPYAVRMRDDVLLATDVYLPSRGSRWPVLVSRLPYDKAGDECFMPDIARWFNERGYAVVVQDVRGKVRSGGALAPFETEVADGYDTIEWVTEQSWCNGSIGMFGDSYFGWTQWAAAASRHRALRAIAPRVISADIGDVTSRGGLFALEVTALWALETWVDERLYAYDGELEWGVRPLSEVVPAALGGRRSAFLDDTARRGLPPSARLSVDADLPALHLGGWWDLVNGGQFATWRRSVGAQRAPQYLVVDAVDHGWTRLRPPGEPYVDPLTDASTLSAFLDDYLGPLLPFFDYYVSGVRAYDAPPVRWMLTHESWRHDDRWPPRDSAPVDWFLTGGPRGGLAEAPDRAERVVEWAQDPDDLVPSLAHAYHPLIEPADDSVLIRRDDVLTFETEPVPRPVDLAGPISVALAYESSSPTARIMASLCDVSPDGSALRITDGAGMVTAQGRSAVDLGDIGYRVRPGHRLRLQLSASEFPRYLPDTGTDEHPWTAREFRRTEHRIVTGGRRGARLRCFALRAPGDNA